MAESEALKTTPLTALHRELGARMVPFAGYDMPLHYGPGILREHLHTREGAGLFDVSHMGQLALRADSVADAARALERLVPVDVVGLKEGRQRYALFTNDSGGILDDFMVANRGDHLFLVVNAACKEADEAHLRQNLPSGCELERLDERALLALQGPAAAGVMAALAPETGEMRFMDVRAVTLEGAAGCIVSRSGYTGEDGFEISVPDDAAVAVAKALLAHGAVEPVGLGARDSLRLEAGLCLYGADLDGTTSPVEAALEWAIQKARRPGGDRAGGFPGAERIFDELAHGPRRRRVGLKPEGRAPVRGGAALYLGEDDDAPVGKVTSGVFGPSVGGPVAMGYVQFDHAGTGERLFAEVRGKRLPVRVAGMPFVKPNYRRG